MRTTEETEKEETELCTGFKKRGTVLRSNSFGRYSK